MNEALRQETERLTRSWAQHAPAWLMNYLVAGVEDPRLNVQSILTRHFLVCAVGGDYWGGLIREEYRFAAVMAWLIKWFGESASTEEVQALRAALERGADNAEGTPVPHFLLSAFKSLPIATNDLTVPNYIESLLNFAEHRSNPREEIEAVLDTFSILWRHAFNETEHTSSAGAAQTEQQKAGAHPRCVSVLEPACGSANDYRHFDKFGLAPFLEYNGLDLAQKNIANARALYPEISFNIGNVFEIEAPDKSFDYCIVHDLFEHLSLEGLRAAAKEICRVTRSGLCLSFFQMDEIPEHLVRPVDEYHWNLLSVQRVKELLEGHGFAVQVLHIPTFLRSQVGTGETHNPNAYTLLLQRA
jgi:SAM-dependent methyltransferase